MSREERAKVDALARLDKRETAADYMRALVLKTWEDAAAKGLVTRRGAR